MEVVDSASFSTDVIYQIVTDRFKNGDVTNDPSWLIYNPSSKRFYYGGDWVGIINKIEDGQLTDLGVTALYKNGAFLGNVHGDSKNNYFNQLGNIVWEGGMNHSYTVPSTIGLVSVYWQN